MTENSVSQGPAREETPIPRVWMTAEQWRSLQHFNRFGPEHFAESDVWAAPHMVCIWDASEVEAYAQSFAAQGAVPPTTEDWVLCPICGEPDMEQETDSEGNVLISCVNHACASNGGSNTSGLSLQRELNSAHRLWEKEHDELVMLREKVRCFDAGAQSRTPTNLESRTVAPQQSTVALAHSAYLSSPVLAGAAALPSEPTDGPLDLESKTPAGLPLTIGVESDQLVIRIGVDTLAWCFEISDDNQPYDEKAGDFRRAFKVTDRRKFAKGVGIGLRDEEEDGSTPLTKILDAACIRAVEDDMGVDEDGRIVTNEMLHPAASVPAASSSTKEPQEWMTEVATSLMDDYDTIGLQTHAAAVKGIAEIIAKHYAASSPEPNQGGKK